MLDPIYKQEIQKYLQDWVKVLPSLKKGGSARAKQIIKYENPYDYFYGYMIGQMEGFALGFYQGLYNKHPTDEEHIEIMEMIEVHYKDLRKILSKSMK